MDSTLDLRVSDADREEVAAQLRRHTADGRLTTEEFSERLDEVYAAKTRRELDATLRELPSLQAPAPPRPVVSPPRARGPAAPFLFFACCMIAIWMFSGAGYFWPIWPLMGWGIPLFLALRAGHARGPRGGCRR